MRAMLAGIICCLCASAVLAQATGDVEGIGFDNNYRPGCWTPMVVRLTPNSGTAFEGKIAVYQDDADHNHPIFTRPVSLRGNAEGGGEKTQRFWMYFIPQADLVRDGSDPIAVNRRLLVYLTTDDGKQVARLPITSSINEIDRNDNGRGTRLMLCVIGSSTPVFQPYGQGGPSGVIGMKEDLMPVLIPAGNIRALLPESVLGYEGVDAVVWTDADPGVLSTEQRSALEGFIRRGGKFVVSQTGKPNTWEMVRRGFAPLLPVEVQAIEKVDDLKPLKRITGARYVDLGNPSDDPKWADVAKPPFDYAVGKPKVGAVVDEYEDEGSGRPFIVRWGFGSGTVTWVAQDLGDQSLTGRASIAEAYTKKNESYKWMWVWDRVMDWHDASLPAPLASDSIKGRFGDSSRENYQMTRSFLAKMEFGEKSAGYLSLAFLFFIAYWIIAGPGSYLFMAGRKRTGQSWWAFAAVALVATTLTVIVVKLVLRGSAEIHHVTFVRQTPGEPTMIQTQLGLYIPKDGGQRVELKNPLPDSGSYVAAFPNLAVTDEGPPPIEYEVPVFDAKAVTFPFRSTLTKLQTQWVGDLPQGANGGGRLLEPKLGGWIEGMLSNTTGHDLQQVYVAFRTRGGNGKDEDHLLFVHDWGKGGVIDLNKSFNANKAFINEMKDTDVQARLQADPGAANAGWEQYWYSNFEHDHTFEDRPDRPSNFVMLSLFDRLAPVGAVPGTSREHVDLHRPALRDLDVSGALATGKLIVLAQTGRDDKLPMPVPLQVEGDDVGGEGQIYYQFLLPLDRSILDQPPPATQPATKPTTLNSSFIIRHSELAARP